MLYLGENRFVLFMSQGFVFTWARIGILLFMSKVFCVYLSVRVCLHCLDHRVLCLLWREYFRIANMSEAFVFTWVKISLQCLCRKFFLCLLGRE